MLCLVEVVVNIIATIVTTKLSVLKYKKQLEKQQKITSPMPNGTLVIFVSNQ